MRWNARKLVTPHIPNTWLKSILTKVIHKHTSNVHRSRSGSIELKATHILSWIIAIHFSSALLCPSGFFPLLLVCVCSWLALYLTIFQLYCSDRICAIEVMPHHICKFNEIIQQIYSKSCELSHSAASIKLKEKKVKKKRSFLRICHIWLVDTFLFRANFISFFYSTNCSLMESCKMLCNRNSNSKSFNCSHFWQQLKTGLNCNFWYLVYFDWNPLCNSHVIFIRLLFVWLPIVRLVNELEYMKWRFVFHIFICGCHKPDTNCVDTHSSNPMKRKSLTFNYETINWKR